jgi:uncharacterized membrane protein
MGDVTVKLPPTEAQRARLFGAYPPMVYILRTVHVALGSFFAACLIYLYYVVFTVAQLSATVWGATVALVGETVVFMASGGVCPLSTWQRKYGDEKGFLGLFLPIRVARNIFPVALVIGAVPIALILWRALR